MPKPNPPIDAEWDVTIEFRHGLNRIYGIYGIRGCWCTFDSVRVIYDAARHA